MPWREDPFVKFTRRVLFIVIALLIVTVAGLFSTLFVIIGHYRSEAVRVEEGTRKGLVIVHELTSANAEILEQLRTLTAGNVAAVDAQRRSGRCSQYFIVKELRAIARQTGEDPVPSSEIPTPDITGLDCPALLGVPIAG